MKTKLTTSLAIHGDKQQNERDWVLNEFKTGKSPIMVATDVASRGIGMIISPLPLPQNLPQVLLCVNCQCALLGRLVRSLLSLP
jgi:ATP-dependent RNA helicase DDX5/DBP2